ncbi:DUF881 domain-containing protein [Fictibacillus aquaticus]|uniref:NgoFVII family restriction endonuclease n=1 Tax=Fictibacillus aquaticus TaxID=2021314 RepID=A0A235FCL9_9BACL|nr:DUF881 domain-containing protein [Fictibacillus aquaticus]OYD58939.1 hypothetical protein CGZ90_03285 [Fictibacillus aquaticus]
MKMNRQYMLAFVALVLGMMLSVQFQTANNPIERDTRDIWELRADLEEEKKRQQMLNEEIRKNEDLLHQYSSKGQESANEAMEQALADLKKQAGLTEISGQGITITIEPFNEGLVGGDTPVPHLYPDMLRRLINELNRYDALEMSIDGQRVVSRTPIREVNGSIYVNNEPLSSFPIEINVLTDDSKKLHQKIIASPAIEDFIRENFYVEAAVSDQIMLPAYTEPLRVKYMKQVKEDS